jgi:hypothetical protein
MERLDGLSDMLDLRVRQAGEDGERKDFTRQPFGAWERRV